MISKTPKLFWINIAIIIFIVIMIKEFIDLQKKKPINLNTNKTHIIYDVVPVGAYFTKPSINMSLKKYHLSSARSNYNIYTDEKYIPLMPELVESQLTKEGKKHRDNEVMQIAKQAKEHQNKKFSFSIFQEEKNILREIQPNGIIIEGFLDSRLLTQVILPSGSVFKYYIPTQDNNIKTIKEILCANGQILKPDFSYILDFSIMQTTPLTPSQLTAYHEAGHALIVLQFPFALCSVTKIYIQETTTDSMFFFGQTAVRHPKLNQGGWQRLVLQAFGGVAAQQYLANQGKIPKEKIFLGIDDDFQFIEKLLMENNQLHKVDLNKLFQQAYNIVVNNKDLLDIIAKEIDQKKILQQIDIERIIKDNHMLVTKLRI
ncbi:hypothetical protein M33023_00190 [Candidatus Phytoplasma asteris]|uniref:Peptidase M41 domain-containing protein n=1 Tax=Candidatus Phytoplasma asteris TaxID=85620 RepID=A0ABZ2YFG9_9MOLU